MAEGGAGAPVWLVVLLAVFLILYLFFDVAYFTRMFYTLLKARYFKTKICIMEKTEFKCKQLNLDIQKRHTVHNICLFQRGVSQTTSTPFYIT